VQIRKENIIPDPNQPRKTFDPELLSELKDSMRGEGPDQPLVVRPIADGKYMIVTGERRYLADENESIECIVREVNEREAREMQFRENMQRENVDVLELGKAYDEYRKKYGATQTTLARVLGVTPTTVSRYESTYLNLSETVKGLLLSREITKDAAYFLSTIPGSERQLEVAAAVAGSDLSVEQARQVITEARDHPRRSIAEVLQRAEKENDSVQIEKAISVIPQPERKEEARTTIEAYGVNPKLAPEIAEAVAQQPERSIQEIVEEVRGTADKDKALLSAQRSKGDSDLCIMIARQMKTMNTRLADLKSLPAENAEEFLAGLQILHDTAGETLGRLRLPSKTAEAVAA